MVTNTIPHENQVLKVITAPAHDLTVYSDRVVIQYTDFLSRLIQREKVIPIAEIKEVRLYASRFTNEHHIQLSVINRDGHAVSLLFNINQLAEVQGVKRQIEACMVPTS